MLSSAQTSPAPIATTMSNGASRTDRRERRARVELQDALLVALTVIGATALRAWRLDALSLWFDEGWTAYAASRPSVLAAAAADPTNPPLHYVLAHVLARGAGTSEFALRWGSVLVGALGIVLARHLGRLALGRVAGRYAALLVALSPILWWASREARMYATLSVLVTIAAIGWLTVLRKPAAIGWLALLGGELAVLWAHNSGPVFFLALNVGTAAVWLARRSAAAPSVKPWVAGQALVLLAWAPAQLAPWLALPAANSAVSAGPRFGARLVADMWETYWTGSWAITGHEWPLRVLAAYALLLSVVVVPWRRPPARQLLLLWLLTVGGIAVALAMLGNELHGRYLAMAAPLLLVPLGGGIAALRSRWARAVALAPILCGLVGVAHLTVNVSAYGNDDARALVRSLAGRLGSRDTLVAWSYADRYELAYYAERFGLAARRLILREVADLEEIAPLLPRTGRIAQNEWYGQRADYRGMLECLLSHGARPPDRITVAGMSALVYEEPPATVGWRTSSAALPVGAVARVGGLPPFTADRALCLPVEIALTRRSSAPLKVAVIVEDPFGTELAHADAVVADALQRTASEVDAGATLRAFPVVRLPVGTPPGSYPVRLQFYEDPGNGSAITVGQPVAVGSWTVPPGAGWTPSAEAADLPQVGPWQAGNGIALIAHDVPDAAGEALLPGDGRRLTLLWRGDGRLPALWLSYDGGARRVEVPSTAGSDRDVVTREWRTVTAPSDAGAGVAELQLPDGTVIGTYTIAPLPDAVRSAPPLRTPIGTSLPPLGELLGLREAIAGERRGEPLAVTLVWRAGAHHASARLTVSVQLLGPDGRVLAQHDGQPAGGGRPTTTWRAGEVIVDEHELSVPADAPAGRMRLIAAVYDPRTGRRIPDAVGRDHIVLVDEVALE